MPTWLKFIENQTIPLSDIGFIFELGEDDEPTHNALWEWHMAHPEVSVFDGTIRSDERHVEHEEGIRAWAGSDYSRMAIFRNHLLDKAIAIQPEVYYSLDSDIILENPKTLETLYNLVQIEEYDAVSTLSYMWMDQEFPSVMSWVFGPGGPANRDHKKYKMGSLFQADVIMASVMMSNKVYNTTRYRWHRLGEDLGWATDCAAFEYNLYCASYLYTPHIMHRSMLEPYLKHGDPRNPFI